MTINKILNELHLDPLLIFKTNPTTYYCITNNINKRLINSLLYKYNLSLDNDNGCILDENTIHSLYNDFNNLKIQKLNFDF